MVEVRIVLGTVGIISIIGGLVLLVILMDTNIGFPPVGIGALMAGASYFLGWF